jgi:hypothetical protein
MCWWSWNLEASSSWNPQGLSSPVTGLLKNNTYKHTNCISSEPGSVNRKFCLGHLLIETIFTKREFFLYFLKCVVHDYMFEGAMSFAVDARSFHCLVYKIILPVTHLQKYCLNVLCIELNLHTYTTRQSLNFACCYYVHLSWVIEQDACLWNANCRSVLIEMIKW